MSLGQSRVLLVGLEGCVFREKGGREGGREQWILEGAGLPNHRTGKDTLY